MPGSRPDAAALTTCEMIAFDGLTPAAAEGGSEALAERRLGLDGVGDRVEGP
jgi:hypothetical protein